MNRDKGCGKLRLGSVLQLNEGIYSLLYIANLKREYIKLSLRNEKKTVNMTLNENHDGKKQRQATGHKKCFKGISQGIQLDNVNMEIQLEYLEQIPAEEFTHYFHSSFGTKTEYKRNLSERKFTGERAEFKKIINELNDEADQAKYNVLIVLIIFVGVCQVVLSYLVAADIFSGLSTIEYPEDYGFAVSKFISGLLLH